MIHSTKKILNVSYKDNSEPAVPEGIAEEKEQLGKKITTKNSAFVTSAPKTRKRGTNGTKK